MKRDFIEQIATTAMFPGLSREDVCARWIGDA